MEEDPAADEAAAQPLLSKNETSTNYSREEEEEAAEEPTSDEGLAARCLECMGCYSDGAGSTHICIAMTVSYKGSNGSRTFMTDRSAKRSVKLFEKDEDAFARHQDMEFKVPRLDVENMEKQEEKKSEKKKKQKDPKYKLFPDDVECTV